MKWACFSVFGLIIVPIELALYLFNIYDPEAYARNIKIFDVLLIIRSLLKALIDSYLFSQFIIALVFFYRKKKEAMEEIERKSRSIVRFSGYNKFIIVFTVAAWVLNIVNSVLSIIFWPLYHSSVLNEDPRYNFMYKFCFRTYSWTISFMTLMGLLTLFHH